MSENLNPFRVMDSQRVWELLGDMPYGRLAVQGAGLVRTGAADTPLIFTDPQSLSFGYLDVNAGAASRTISVTVSDADVIGPMRVPICPTSSLGSQCTAAMRSTPSSTPCAMTSCAFSRDLQFGPGQDRLGRARDFGSAAIPAGRDRSAARRWLSLSLRA